MQDSETDTLPAGGTDNAQPSTDIDNPANLDFADPEDEKQDTGQAPEATGTEGEADENAEGAQESAETDPDEEAEAGTDAAPAKDKPKSADDTVQVTMPDGAKLSVSELKQGYLRQSDYTRKAQDLSNQRQSAHATAVKAQNALTAVQSLIQASLPPMPNPALAHTDPGLYVAQKAQREQAEHALNHALRLAEQPKQVLGEMNQQQLAAHLTGERAKLVQLLPSVATDKGAAELAKNVQDVAQFAGISGKELEGYNDHRVFFVMNLAAEGLAARKAKEAAKVKVAGVPPVAQPRQRQNGAQGQKNRDAMRKLQQSGSIHDAVTVDFE